MASKKKVNFVAWVLSVLAESKGVECAYFKDGKHGFQFPVNTLHVVVLDMLMQSFIASLILRQAGRSNIHDSWNWNFP